MKIALLAGAAVALVPLPVLAQDHSTMDHSAMDHSSMDHTAMDHTAMDHSAMGHGPMDHSAMDHPAMGHSAMMSPNPSGAAGGSGTALLPAAEGMMPGIHIDLGGEWQAMAHGYGWLVHSEQTGPRGDDPPMSSRWPC
ncbi:hypothetical protein [Aurantiacibacter xanthus]|uniref:hypothetical protein n=1 Tax=Aurantiacibacter xanthus TaxID=1784712 RepID=UPI0024822EFB|nr:hypothetical protein [Aurantiacibacter xanthus]